MWTYQQSTGALTDAAGLVVAHGYSGAGEGKNNPVMEAVREVGPIPAGQWRIDGPPVNTPTHGPYVLHLQPLGDTHGRSAFLIHGDSVARPGTASKGCIILPRAVREEVWASGDRDLEVIA